jgi:hypothetical protein
MALVVRPFAPSQPHGDLNEVLPDVFFVTGTVRMPGPLPVRFSRNMTVVREGERLVLINTVRLDERGLTALDRLGKVTDVIRIAGNHGMDDPFYADRYGAKVWALKGQRYTSGFNTKAPDTYFAPHAEVDSASSLPLEGARLHFIHSRPTEGLLLMPRHDGVLISGDCLQNWATTDAYFSWVGGFLMRRMGFIRPHNIGPAWQKQCKPPAEDVRALLNFPFANMLPAHGAPVLGGAVDRYRPVIEALPRSAAAAAAS